MKLLSVFLKGFFGLLFLLIVVFGLTVLAWWMQWPLITGVVILLVLFGLFMTWLAGRAIYRWNDKRRFVRKIVDEQAALEKQSSKALTRIASAWQDGMAMFASSPYRFKERFALSQPWFIVLDTTQGSPIFNPIGETLPNSTDSPLLWHFLSNTVLLHCHLQRMNREEWNELLTSLAKIKRDAPLRGIIVLSNLQRMAQAPDEDLFSKGRLARSHVQEIMLTMNRSYPVFMLAEGLEGIVGMEDVLKSVPPEDFNVVLGEIKNSGVDARSASRAAKARLEEMLRATAVNHASPKGNSLKALEALKGIGEKLHQTVEILFREIAHTTKPVLAGVAFCGMGHEGSERPAFLTGLLSYELPKVPPAPPLSSGLPFMTKTRAIIMATWLLVLLGLCALMGVNVLYQYDAISEKATDIPSVAHDPLTDSLYKEMVAISRLRKAERIWYMPTFGQNILGETIAARQTEFCKNVYSKLINPLIGEYRTRLINRETMTISERQEMVAEIMWLTNVASNRIKKRNQTEASENSLALTTLNTSRWDPITGRIIVKGIDWMADGEQIRSLAGEMRALLASTLASGHMALKILTGEIDGRYFTSRVCLSDYWPHIPPDDPNNICVRPTYTSQGDKVFKAMLANVEALDDGSTTLSSTTKAFRSEYFRKYAEQWTNFSKAFAKIRTAMEEGDVFVSYTDAKSITNLPHFQALQRFGAEILPLKDAGQEAPLWLSTSLLMDLVIDIAMFQDKHEASNDILGITSIVAEAPELLQRLRAETNSAKEARQMLGAAEHLNTFFNDLLALLQVVGDPEKSYTLAAIWFGGKYVDPDKAKGVKSDTELAEQGFYANARRQLEIIQNTFKKKGNNPSMEFVPSMLDFIAQGVTVQTAKVVQDAWERDVLGSATALYRQDDVTKLFGEKGIVQTFVDSRLKPFLTRKGKALSPAVWGDIVFPFTKDALRALARAEVIAANPPVDTYYVELRSQPTLVNVDAKERVDQTTLSLQCQDKTQTLVNRNYPRNENFQYSVKQCEGAELEIAFPSFVLQKKYPNFTEFLRDFQYGEREFTSDDFSGPGDNMEAAGVKKVTVRILPDNVMSVLEKEGGELPTLPDRITYVW
ncbi:MAG: hypothetical protein IJT59_04825 [Desulfovibrionaceae bacterium]|nr:hypothetical protein [Desulfovibrionaceae bacterium]